MGLVSLTEYGLYCSAGDFYIDPWKPVERAVITHAHSDHARWGSKTYLCSEESVGLLRIRLGESIHVTGHQFGSPLRLGNALMSFHPAGHCLGAAQVRIEVGGYVTVISGDYKVAEDRTCRPFELIHCHEFVTESTFGLPIYRWPAPETIQEGILRWWRKNKSEGRASILFGYALGKAQRALGMMPSKEGPIVLHGALKKLTQEYELSGVRFPEWGTVADFNEGFPGSESLVLAPPSAIGTPWLKRFGPQSQAFLSGWMAVRGMRRRRGVDQGFVLSDHVDWPSLMGVIEATGAERILVTHGYTDVVVRELRDRGMDAALLRTEWQGESDLAEPTSEEVYDA